MFRYYYLQTWTLAKGRMACPSTEDAERASSKQKREAASVAAGLLGLEVSDLVQNHVVHASIAVERFKAHIPGTQVLCLVELNPAACI